MYIAKNKIIKSLLGVKIGPEYLHVFDNFRYKKVESNFDIPYQIAEHSRFHILVENQSQQFRQKTIQ